MRCCRRFVAAPSSSIAPPSAPTPRVAPQHRLRERGAHFLDAPVSGGVEGARDGTLAIMVGGDAQAFERAQPVLQAMGRTVTHFGASGAGQAAKATNQIMCAGIIQAVAEAMAFAKSEDLPLDRLIETLGKGAGSSWYFVQSRAEHPARQLSGRLPRAAAREGPEDLPRHGRAPWRATAADRDDAGALPAADRAGPRRRRHLDAVPPQGRAVRRATRLRNARARSDAAMAASASDIPRAAAPTAFSCRTSAHRERCSRSC